MARPIRDHRRNAVPPAPSLPPPKTGGLTDLDVARATSLADEGGEAGAKVESQEDEPRAPEKKADG